MTDMTRKIREIAKDLLSNGKIDVFIGFRDASLPLSARPLFITAKDFSAGDSGAALTDALVWNSFCSNNLAVFLPKYFENTPFRKSKDPVKKPVVGIVAKGCDLRSIIALSKERHAPIENVLTIGVPCTGKYDGRKLKAALAAQSADEGDVASWEEKSEQELSVKLNNGKTLNFTKQDLIQDACLECRFPMPENTTFLVEGKAKEPGDGGYGRIDAFEKLSLDERWSYFRKEMEKCIRCNACRQACPTCYCKECFAEMTDLKWLGASTDLSDAMIFHIIRIFHQAGRCIECDACYRACPMGVDLRMFTRKMVKDTEILFKYLPGFSRDETPPLSTFKEGDTEEFITEP